MQDARDDIKAAAERDRDRDRDREEERALVVRAQTGDKTALGQLLKRHGPMLYRSVLLPRLGSEAAAMDALSETYAKVVTKIGLFEWQNVGIYPWLRTVAMRVALDHLRARKRTLVWSDEDVARELDAQADGAGTDLALIEHHDRHAVKARVDQAMAALHPRYADAIRMRILQELPREQVALALGVSPATFDVLLHRAIAALKKQLGQTP